MAPATDLGPPGEEVAQERFAWPEVALQLEVPDTSGRYYVLQFVDAWTNNFAYVGHRATGTRAGSFLLVPPGGYGGTSGATAVIRCPTAIATIVGRWAVDGPDDLPAVRGLQDALTLSPTTEGSIRGLPEPNIAVAENISFFEQLRYEAAYAMVYEDASGDQLNGGSRYQLHFDTTPPVGAFWSVTMYDMPNFYLVADAIDRYSIGDRTPDPHRADDGSLTIFMQREQPESPEERANWLPTPDGDFRPLLRMYESGESIFDGRYVLPPITKRR